jgi:terminase small subunit-like protein
MSRGRRAKPAEVKQLLGNPGKRRLALSGDGHGTSATLPGSSLPKIEPPAWLTQPREREVFGWVLEYLPANIVRVTDVQALARWATWINVFVTCKIALDGRQHWYTTSSDHSPEIHREHPLAKRMDKAEAHLVTLEDRLCLNIVARNNVMHRILNAPPAHPGAGLFADEPAADDDKKTDNVEAPTPATDNDPLGYLARAGKQSLN